jgi:hypothetical protein
MVAKLICWSEAAGDRQMEILTGKIHVLIAARPQLIIRWKPPKVGFDRRVNETTAVSESICDMAISKDSSSWFYRRIAWLTLSLYACLAAAGINSGCRDVHW